MQMILADTWAFTAAGAFALSENSRTITNLIRAKVINVAALEVLLKRDHNTQLQPVGAHLAQQLR